MVGLEDIYLLWEFYVPFCLHCLHLLNSKSPAIESGDSGGVSVGAVLRKRKLIKLMEN